MNWESISRERTAYHIILDRKDNPATRERLYRTICNNLVSNSNLFTQEQMNHVYEAIEHKLGNLWRSTKSIYIESSYNETAWKDMVSLYYVHVFPRASTKVIRIHLFSSSKEQYLIDKNEDVQEMSKNYLGFFNLRPVFSPNFMISYIMPNFMNYKIICGNNSIYMLGYSRKVHIHGIELTIKTFPFFLRDGIVTVCAQSDIMMIGRYFYRKLYMPQITLSRIMANDSYDKLNIYPTEGISGKQILDIFTKSDILTKLFYGDNKISISSERLAQNAFYSLQSIGQLVFSYIDSRLPVLLVIGDHVVVATGATNYEYSNFDIRTSRKLAIYDDSSELFKILSQIKGNPTKSNAFMEILDWTDIEAIADRYSDGKLSVLGPQYSRVTLSYFMLRNIFDESNFWSNYKYTGWRRLFLIDCNQLKSFLLKNIVINDYDIEVSELDRVNITQYLISHLIDRILKADLSHYYWCLEIPVADLDNQLFFNYTFFRTDYSMENSIYHNYCLNSILKTDIIFAELIEKASKKEIKRALDNMFDDYIHVLFTSEKQIDM